LRLFLRARASGHAARNDERRYTRQRATAPTPDDCAHHGPRQQSACHEHSDP